MVRLPGALSLVRCLVAGSIKLSPLSGFRELARSVFHSSEVASRDKLFPVFRRKSALDPKMAVKIKVLRSFTNSGCDNHVTRRHIEEVRKPQLHGCQNLKIRMIWNLRTLFE